MTENVSDEMLMALADGELPADQSAHLMRRVRDDAALAKRYAVFADTRSALQAAYPAEPAPDRLVEAILAAPAGPDPTSAVTGAKGITPLPRRARAVTAGWPAALAASLVLTVGLGGFLTGRLTAPETGATMTPQLAAQALDGVLTGGTADLARGRTARALASFDTELGLCRMIAVDAPGEPSERIIACRDAVEWRVALSVVAGEAGMFQPAADATVATIDSFLDGIGAGAPLAPEAEAEALEDGLDVPH